MSHSPTMPAPDVPAAVDDANDSWSPMPDLHPGEAAWVVVLWRRVCREPALLVSTAYLLIGFLGLWSSYWFFRGFGIPVLEYLQASDYLVAGLRHPAYLLILGAGFLVGALVSWPDTLRRRHPERINALRARHWWWRLVFAQSRWMSWEGVGLHPVTGISLVVASFLCLGSAYYMLDKGERVRAGLAGNAVRVQLAGDAAPLPGQALLLGTSSAYVYLWWPAQRRAEVLPIAAVKRLQAPLKPAAGAQLPASAPAPRAAPAVPPPARAASRLPAG